MSEKHAPIKAYSQKELHQMYGVSPKTLRSWLRPFRKDIGKLLGKTYTPAQVKIIFDHLSPPLLVD